MEYLRKFENFSNNEITVKSVNLKEFRKELDSYRKVNNDIFKRIRYFTSSDIGYMSDDIDPHFIVLKSGEKIIGLCKLGNYMSDSDGVYSISFFTIDKNYRNKGYSRILADELFRFAKERGWVIKTSTYTYVGFKKLRHLLNEYSKKHDVNFIDKKDDDHLMDHPDMYDDQLNHKDDI